MALNYVTVTGHCLNADGSPSSGNIRFEVTDLIWNSVSPAWIGVLGHVGASLDASGNFAVPLLAMDNASMSGNWAWKVTLTLSGREFPPRLITVKYSGGATQDLASLLNTSTLA